MKPNETHIGFETDKVRICSKCGVITPEGYVDVDDIYCSEKCLPYSAQAWEKEHKSNPDDCYWTQWTG